MGIPSDIVQDLLGGPNLSGPQPTGRTTIVPTTTGVNQLLLGPPPAGFSRRIAVSPTFEGGLFITNPIGGASVDVDVLINTTVIGRHTLAADSDTQTQVSPILGPSQSLFMSYTAASSPLNWIISYADYPSSLLVPFFVPIINGDALLVPAPPAGFRHVLDGIPESGSGYVGVNFDSGVAPNIFTKIGGAQITSSSPMFDNNIRNQRPSAGLSIGSTTGAVEVNADALAANARACGAYWVIAEQ